MDTSGTTKSVKKHENSFRCEICDYTCFKKHHLTKHLSTHKHKMASWTLVEQPKVYAPPSKKVESVYHCDLCDYTSSNSQHYSKHLLAAKHLKNEKCKFLHKKCKSLHKKCNPSIKLTNCKTHMCHTCNKTYKYASGLYKHIRNTDCQSLISENNELRQSIIDISKNMQTPNIISHTTNTTNTFNLQIFLNETCKDAINITDFIENLQISLSDIENVGSRGFVKGISNIIIKNLADLDETKRPIHCSDAKRDTLYIKDNDIWEKDKAGNQKMANVVKHVSSKNLQNLQNWRNANPDFNNSESPVSDTYQNIVRESCEVLNGHEHGNSTAPETKIIKNISKTVIVKKLNLSS